MPSAVPVLEPFAWWQFDMLLGEALAGPVPHDFGGEVPPPRIGRYFQHVGMLMAPIRTESVRVYETRVEGDSVQVKIGP